MSPRRVILESPYAAANGRTVEQHVAYANKCMMHALQRGEGPIASHLLWTRPGLLRDEDQHERALGLAAGLAWYGPGVVGAFYLDVGLSPGMRAAARIAAQKGARVEARSLHGRLPETHPLVLELLGEVARGIVGAVGV